MKLYIKTLAVLGFVVLGFAITAMIRDSRTLFFNPTPKPPSQAYEYSIYRTGPYEVAKVFGRSSGCREVNPEFIQLVSNISLKVNLDPRIAAATISVESSCNSLAVSNKGALGMMQVMVPIWNQQFDFSEVNLLNARENIEVGTKILSDLIGDYGMEEGIRRYQGIGICSTCDLSYTEKILTLSGRK